VEDFESGTAQTSAALRAAITADIPPAVHFLGTYRPVGRALHMLWDSVIHERDVSLPLGIGGDHTDDELAAVGAYALLYAAASLAPFDPSVSVEVHLTDRTTHRYHLVLTDAMVKLTTSQRDAVGEAPWIRGSTLATIDAFAGRGTLDIVEFSTDTVRQRFAAAPAAGALQPL
jgi:CRISPR/Cas system-associated exonuclease Cas4 (RecB family)